MVFEGVPSYPTPARLFEVVDKYAVTHLYTAPTAIRAFMGVSARVSEEASYILFCKKKIQKVVLVVFHTPQTHKKPCGTNSESARKKSYLYFF